MSGAVSPRVLLVEDDDLIGTMVEMNLRARGYEVRWERSAEAALPAVGARARAFDVVLLDVMLPGMDGLALAARMRRDGVGTPVLMLTVRDEVRTKVAALESGVDDYLTKPFDMEELVARVRALIRRGQAAGELPSSGRIEIAGGELRVDDLVFVDALGTGHELSEKEAHLLALFARSPGRTLSRSDIIEEVWGMHALPPARTVDNFVLRLRRVLGDDGETPRHLVTARGRGYRYEP